MFLQKRLYFTSIQKMYLLNTNIYRFITLFIIKIVVGRFEETAWGSARALPII